MRLTADRVIGGLAAFSSNKPIRHVLRAPLHFVPPGLKVSVLGGPLQGKRWIVGSSIHRCWLGTYDRAESSLMQRHLRPGAICFDIGAQAGYHTLYAATAVGPSGHVFAFEPSPRNVVNLKKHLAMNHLSNVTVVEAAVSDFNGLSYFDPSSSAVAGHLSARGDLAVGTLSLDHEVDGGRLPAPDYIKIDAEGAELRILKGARRLLTRYHPTLSVETHQWLPDFSTVREECIGFLGELGYLLAAPDPADPDSGTHLCASALA